MIFVDTRFFIALLDPQDRNHPRAVEALRVFQGKRLSDLLLTTNNVVLETITVARYEVGHALAVKPASSSTTESSHGSIARRPRKRPPASPTSKSTPTRSTAPWTA
jgi:predicted nucleic acid-binding protein